jgi:hypothetical protein
MKNVLVIIAMLAAGSSLHAQEASKQNQSSANHLYIDVHHLEAGKVKFADVAAAHQKDLATEGKYGVSFMKYWVDEKNGLVYCLSSAPGTDAIRKTHAEAHGLMPEQIYQVTAGDETPDIKPENLFLDIHYLGEGKVTAKDVSEAHKKDLAAEGQHGVSFINYWVDEKNGVVMCLSQANNAQDVVQTHTEAHGLIPASIASVQEGH